MMVISLSSSPAAEEEEGEASWRREAARLMEEANGCQEPGVSKGKAKRTR